MGMDLLGRGVDFHFNWTNWRRVLELAYRYGWVPAGTELDHFGKVDEELAEQYRHPYEDWDGTYFGNSFQWVTAEDAANIAQALERALEDIPDEDTVSELAARLSFELEGAGVRSIDKELEKRISVLDWFSGEEGKQFLREFIAFCRVGGFRIA